MALLYLDLGSMAAWYPDYSGSMALSMWKWGRQHGLILLRLRQHGRLVSRLFKQHGLIYVEVEGFK